MKKHLSKSACVLVSIFMLSCVEGNAGNSNINSSKKDAFDIPIVHHDLSYIPFDPQLDDINFTVCDSNGIVSGRSYLKYASGRSQLIDDIQSNYEFKQAFADFDGFVIVRFLMNCKGEYGRYRSQSLHLDFTPQEAPEGLNEHLMDVIKGLDNWTKLLTREPQTEYSKYINLKISDGQIEHVLL